MAHSGSVHVFVRRGDQWTLQQRLSAPDDSMQDLFGYSVSLQQDRLAVGAPFDATNARYSGAVYMFERSAGSWSAPQKIKSATPSASDLVGWIIALDGDTLVAGGFGARRFQQELRCGRRSSGQQPGRERSRVRVSIVGRVRLNSLQLDFSRAATILALVTNISLANLTRRS